MSSVSKSDKMGPTLTETDFLKMVTFIRGELSHILATASTEDSIKTYVSDLVRYIEATEDSLTTAEDSDKKEDDPDDAVEKVKDPENGQEAPKLLSDAVKIIKQEIEEVVHLDEEKAQEEPLENGEQIQIKDTSFEEDYGGETDENSDVPPDLMYDVKAKIDDPLTCKNCVKKFDTEAAFQAHINSTPGSKRFKCTGCCKNFKQNVSLKLHRVEENHGINEENAAEMEKFIAKLFKCGTCDKKFLTRSALDSHVLTHTGKKPHKCRTCGKGFKQRRSLKLHAEKEGHSMSKSHHSDKRVKEKIKLEKKDEIKREKREIREKHVHREKREHREKRKHREHRETRSESKRSRSESKRSRRESKSQSLSPVRNKVYRCKHCDRIYSSQNQLNSHMKVHAKGKEFGCSTCGRCFTRKETLEKHVESNCAADVFPVQVKCSMCEEMFSRRSLLDVHLSKHMKPVNEVETAEGVLLESNGADLETVDNFLQNSERKFNNDEINALANQIALGVFKDDKPSGNDGSQTAVIQKPLNIIRPPLHQQKGKRGRPPGTRKPPHQCKFCPKTFKRRREWRNHQYLHTGEKPHVCDICGKTFRLRQVMSLHMNTHGENLFKCNVCDKSYPYKNQLVRHSFTHTGIRPYKCEQCGKGFLSKPELARHRDTHTPGGVKTFVCDICGKSCQNIRKHHLAVHTPREKVPCEICHKEYVSNAKLKVHMLTHTSTKSYICPICGKGFSMNKYLSKHMMLSHGEKKHKCAICGKAFAFSQQLRMHQRTHSGMSGENVPDLPPQSQPIMEQQPQTVLNEHALTAAHYDMQSGLLVGIPERSLAGMPERTITTGMPESTIITVMQEHANATGIPERTIAGIPERTMAGIPESSLAGMPERTIAGLPSGIPERTIAELQTRTTTELQDRTLLGMSDRSMPVTLPMTMPVTLPMSMPVMPAHSGMPVDRPISGMHPMMHERTPVIDNTFIYPYTTYASTYPSPYL